MDGARPTPLAPHVVVLGAGFGGLAATRALARADVDVTLVDQRNFHTFQPLLYEVATAGLDPSDVAYPVRAAFRRADNVRFRLGRVSSIDFSERVVCFAGEGARHDRATEACQDDLAFDYLIVASGVVANFFGTAGAPANAHPLYTLADAQRLRDHLLRRLEEADGEHVHSTDGTLNFVVVGGGPTGVEVAGAVAELLDMAVHKDGFGFDRSAARVVLVDFADTLLTAFKPTAQRYAADTLRSRGIELRLGTMVDRVEADAVHLADGSVIPTRTVIWAGGVTAGGTITSAFGAQRTANGGRVEVDELLRPEGLDDVFVVGDAAAIPGPPGDQDRLPQLAQVAIQSGRHAASQVLARVAGGELRAFRYRDKGIMATIGRRAAVAELTFGPVLRGTLGWLAWFGLHLVYLIGFRNKLTVLVNWSWRYLNWTSGPRVIVDEPALVPPRRM